jgi:hypothetical protein
MMMRKTSLVLLSAAAGAAMTLFATEPQIFSLTSAKAAVADIYRQLDLFGGVFELVRADYVDVPDDAKLIKSAINGMLAGLDPHSSYMDAKSFRDMQVETHGEFGGVGLEVTMENSMSEFSGIRRPRTCASAERTFVSNGTRPARFITETAVLPGSVSCATFQMVAPGLPVWNLAQFRTSLFSAFSLTTTVTGRSVGHDRRAPRRVA